MELKNLDIELLVDKSASMGTRDCNGKSRWEAAEETAFGLASLAGRYDSDGIVLVPFNNLFSVVENVTPETVAQLFKEHTPFSGTKTDAALKDRLDAHFRRREGGSTKSTCLLVLTDGAPDDREAVATVIVDATKKMGADEELAIQFIQVGDDGDARQFLQWLDDNLVAKGAKFDIVDTVQMTQITDIESVLIGAFTG